MDLGADLIGVLVEAGAWQLLRFAERQFILVEPLAQRVLSSFIMRRATEAVFVRVGTGARHVRVAVDHLLNPVDVYLLHVFPANTEGVR